MTPAARMAAILTLLARAPGHLLPSHALWAAVPDYEGGLPSGRRMYRHDLRALAARGLVNTDISTSRTPNRTGVELRFIPKPKDCELTADEHAALRAARQMLGAPSAPTSDGRDTHGTLLDVAMDAVRVLEEHGERMTVAELADELRAAPTVVLSALQELNTLDVHAASVFEGVLLVDDFDETDEPLPAEQVWVCASRNLSSALRPLRGYGLDTVGRFAYTAAETADRLAVITAALAEPKAAIDVDALRSAQCKLQQWAHHLASGGHEPSAASRYGALS